MSDVAIEQLIAGYMESAVAHGGATLNGDHKTANKSYDKLVKLVAQIRAFGNEGSSAILALSRDRNESVACWAATHSLKYNEEAALGALSLLAEKSGPIGFGAKMVIQQWHKGQLNV